MLAGWGMVRRVGGGGWDVDAAVMVAWVGHVS